VLIPAASRARVRRVRERRRRVGDDDNQRARGRAGTEPHEELTKKRRRVRDVVRVRVPREQSPFVFVLGRPGGIFASLLWRHGSSIDVAWPVLRSLVANSRGDVVIARKLTRR
jgi:hypothetical protein